MQQYFDHKQQKLIKSWHKLSIDSNDPYTAFMAEWIAFNAICYNLFHEKATIERANIDRTKSRIDELIQKLNLRSGISDGTASIERKNDKWNVELHFPEKLFFSVSRKYTEDIIFDLFVKQYKEWYSIDSSSTLQMFESLKNSLYKGNGRHYVINMARIKEYHSIPDIDELNRRHIIVLCEINELKTIKNVLYQVRCNIFHGEKVPGEPNDDRIVTSALPLLNFLVINMISMHSI